MPHQRIDAVGDPTRQRQAAPGDRLGRQQRKIQTAEAQADHQDDRQFQLLRQIGGVMMFSQRYTESAYTLDHDRICHAGNAIIAGADMCHVQFHALRHRGDVRRGGIAQHVRRRQFRRQHDIRIGGQDIRILIAPDAIAQDGASGDRLHARGTHPVLAQGMQ